MYRWSGNTTWGVCIGDLRVNSLPVDNSPTISTTKEIPNLPVALISSSESEAVQRVLSTDFTLRHVAGAGYKLLGICEGRAEAYILTKSSNFKWDCCGPHAVLQSLGGGIVKYQDLFKYSKSGQEEYSRLQQIKYHEPDDSEATGALKWCNHGGVVAYHNPAMLGKIAKVISKMDI